MSLLVHELQKLHILTSGIQSVVRLIFCQFASCCRLQLTEDCKAFPTGENCDPVQWHLNLQSLSPKIASLGLDLIPSVLPTLYQPECGKSFGAMSHHFLGMYRSTVSPSSFCISACWLWSLLNVSGRTSRNSEQKPAAISQNRHILVSDRSSSPGLDTDNRLRPAYGGHRCLSYSSREFVNSRMAMWHAVS